MKKLFLAAALAFAPAVAFAQADSPAPAEPTVAAAPLPDADPALWVVRDEDTTIYLFGTFHLLDGRPWFNDEIRRAFDASDELVLEARLPENPADMQPLVLRYALDPEGRLLSQRLTAEQNAALGEALAPLGAPAAAFDRFEPWFVSLTLAAVAGQRLGLGTDNAPEAILSAAARERGIEIGELEGFEWQFRLFDEMPEEQQLAQLGQALDNLDAMADQLTPMLAAWSIGDVDALVTMLNDSAERDPELHRLLFTNRNAAWAGRIEERMARPGTVFLAVGAGHLVGRDSVLAMLEARGLAAERVPHADEEERTAR